MARSIYIPDPKERELMDQITMVCEIITTDIGEKFLRCCMFPEIMIKLHNCAPTLENCEEMRHEIKCAFLDKDIILKTNVSINLDIRGC